MSLSTEDVKEALAQHDDGEAGTHQYSTLAAAARRWLASQEQTPARVFPNYEKAEMAFRVAFDPTTDEAFTDAIYAAVNAALDYAKDKQNLDYGRLRGVLWYYGVEPTDDLVSALAALGLPHSETDPEGDER